MSSVPLLTIHTDGASRGNPGAAAFAYVIARDGEPPLEEAGTLGELTNNQAEYTALVRALRRALELGPQHGLLIHSDSELMVKQMNGEYRVKNPDLLPLYEEARDLVKRFQGPVRFRHVRRSLNSRADALCNEALDGKRTSSTSSVVAKTVPTARPQALRDEAIDCLRHAEASWSRGGQAPTPEQVWEQLTKILERHGVKLR